ncbi:MAG: endonuclease MutS2 [Desulfovibrio sp.]|nr:MAG: endonuclease MutS2 [Desulfovibrio sp.]
MEHRSLQLLEFPQVLEHVAAFAASEAGADACRALMPRVGSADLDISRLRTENDLLRQLRDWRGRTGFTSGDFPQLDGLFAFLATPSGVVDQDGLFALRSVLAQAREGLRAILGEDEESPQAAATPSPWPLLADRAASVAWPAKLWSGLRRCLSDDGHLRDESSPELMSARSEIRRILQQCTKKARDFIQSQNLSHFLQDDFMTISSDRFVLPLKANFKGRFPGVVHDYSQTGETCYFEPLFLVDLNNTLQALKQEEREAERQVLIYLSSLARDESPSLRSAYDFLVFLDVSLAKCAFADTTGAEPLDITRGGPLRLLEARHPLLAARGETVTPVDIVVDQGRSGLIISGGNAGGKTVCLKSLGLITLMALANIPAPVAEGSSMPFWSDVRAFLGDEQSLQDKVSTFTAQIRHLSRAWDQVGGQSLIILDEFGAGTDPSQGAALAQAVVDKLVDKGAFVAVATHFPALKAYALAKDEVRAASVLFDPKSKKPLFRLAYDQVGASQALDVAREHGLPDEVLGQAEKYLLIDGSDTGSVLERLNTLAVERERELRKLEAKRQDLAQERKKLKERFERERTALMEEVRKQSRDVLDQWREGKISHKKALKELANVRKDLEKAEDKEQEQGGELEFSELSPGMKVICKSWGKPGRIEDLDEKRGQAKVDMGGVSMWVDPHDLSRTSSSEAKGKLIVDAQAGGNPMRLDLRGQRAAEALEDLQRFLDRALLGNSDAVEILHGRGTGALRREVHKFLSEFPAVSGYKLANEEQGGDGMTLVELK